MSETAIEWTERTLNMWTGCRKVSPGCARCYIPRTPPFRIAGRQFDEHGDIPLVFHMDRLERMVRRQRSSLYFVNSLSDVFHEDASDDAIAQLFGAMAAAPQHTFQILTKRPERMRPLLDQPSASRFWTSVWTHAARYAGTAHATPPKLVNDRFVLANVWLGVSIENRRFVNRADLLRATPAAVRFISAEPLLGPLVAPLANGCHGWIWPTAAKPWRVTEDPPLDLTGIDQVIVGGESGRGHRPMRIEWARDLRDAAIASGTAFFFKQWGGLRPKSGGRELDGRTWDEMPARMTVRPARG